VKVNLRIANDTPPSLKDSVGQYPHRELRFGSFCRLADRRQDRAFAKTSFRRQHGYYSMFL